MNRQTAQGGIYLNDQSSARRAMQAYLASKHPHDQISMDVIGENLRTVKGTGVRAQQVDALLTGACRLTMEEVDRMCDLMTGGATAQTAYFAVKNGGCNSRAASASEYGSVAATRSAFTSGSDGGQLSAPRGNPNAHSGSASTGGPRNGGGQLNAPRNNANANTGQRVQAGNGQNAPRYNMQGGFVEHTVSASTLPRRRPP